MAVTHRQAALSPSGWSVNRSVCFYAPGINRLGAFRKAENSDPEVNICSETSFLHIVVYSRCGVKDHSQRRFNSSGQLAAVSMVRLLLSANQQSFGAWPVPFLKLSDM